MSVRQRFRQALERVNGLSLRERGLLLLAVFAVVVLIWDFSTMQPMSQREEVVRSELANLRERVDDLTTSLQALASERGRDADAPLREARSALQAEIEALETRLTERHGGIASPEQSTAVLAGLLAERTGVEIVALENLPPARLTGTGGAPVPGLFVHRVRVVVESDFSGVHDYIQATSDLPPGVFWESMDLSVEQWPTNRIELMLYSVTLDERWLGV